MWWDKSCTSRAAAECESPARQCRESESRIYRVRFRGRHKFRNRLKREPRRGERSVLTHTLKRCATQNRVFQQTVHPEFFPPTSGKSSETLRLRSGQDGPHRQKPTDCRMGHPATFRPRVPRSVLTNSNLLLPFCIIDLGWLSGYLRGISPHQRKAFGPEDTARR